MDQQEDVMRELSAILSSEDGEAMLLLIPLTLVAWADGTPDVDEIEAIAVQHATGHCRDRLLCMSSSTREFLYTHFVYTRPREDLVEHALAALKVHLDSLPAGKASHERCLLLTMCQEVAKATGGFLGIHRISDGEKDIIEALRHRLHLVCSRFS